MKGLVLRLTNISNKALYLADLVSSPSESTSGRKPGPFYISPGQTVDISATSDVSRSLEYGSSTGTLS